MAVFPRFFRALAERRIPQAAAIYLGASWGIIEFVSFAEERYLLSPHWTDVTLLGLALLLPSVLLVTYHHGKPGRDEWVRAEKIGVPANLLVAALVLTMVFSDKDLGAMTTSITLTDESGQSVERVVPKSGFRKRVALFNFDAAPGDTAAAWLRYGLPLALEMDLLQDIFIDVRSFWSLRQKLRDAGFEAGIDVPFSLQRRIAQELHLDHLVAGRVSRGADGVTTIEVQLYETRRGRLLQRRTFSGSDVFAVVDELTVQLKRDLGVPEKHLEEVEDLPVSSLLTSSLPAFHAFSEGLIAHAVRDDWAESARRYEAAVAADPGFTLANMQLFALYINSDQTRAMGPLQAAMDHAYRLPERLQYMVRANHYLMRGEPAKSFAVVQMWTDLFPEDMLAHSVLAQLHTQRNDRVAAITSYRRVLEIDSGQHALLRQIGWLYEDMGDTEQALDYYRRYAEQFADNADIHLSIGSLLARAGDHAQGRASYERALLIDPASVGARLRLATLLYMLGDFDGSVRQYEEALAAARTPEARSQVHHGLVHYHEMRGELRRALEQVELYVAELGRGTSPLSAAVEQLAHLEMYVAVGREEEAWRILRGAESAFFGPYERLPAYGHLQIQLEREDAQAAEAAVADLEQVIEALAFEVLRPRAVHARARIHEIRGEWRQAVERYEEQLRLSPTDHRIHTGLGRCHRQLGQHAEAEEHFRKALRVSPADPHTNYEAALLHRDLGDRARAREHLARASLAWRQADPEFELAREAGARLAELDRLAAAR